MFLVIEVIHWIKVMNKPRLFSFMLFYLLNVGLIQVRSEPAYTLVGGSCGLKFADTFFEVHTYQPMRTRRELCWNILTGSTIITIDTSNDLHGLQYQIQLINETDGGIVEYSSSRKNLTSNTVTVEHNFVTSGKYTLVISGEVNQNHYVARHTILVLNEY